MDFTSFLVIVLLLAFFAGVFGALTGLGGGAVVIPILVLFLHVDMHYALAAGLFSVMATSMGTSITYLKHGFVNIRIGIFLEVAASIGAVIGAYMAGILSSHATQIIFGGIFILLLLFSPKRKIDTFNRHPKDFIAKHLKLAGIFETEKEVANYHPKNTLLSFGMMVIAGITSGLLGIGAGVLKVLAMDNAMELPYKVSTATSNFIIGMTAAAGIGVFYRHGYIQPLIVSPVVIGVFLGAIIGSRLMPKLPVVLLRKIFNLVLFVLAIQMIYGGLTK